MFTIGRHESCTVVVPPWAESPLYACIRFAKGDFGLETYLPGLITVRDAGKALVAPSEGRTLLPDEGTIDIGPPSDRNGMAPARIVFQRLTGWARAASSRIAAPRPRSSAMSITGKLAIRTNIAAAVRDHRAWRKALKAALEQADLALVAEQARNQEDCPFTQWLDSRHEATPR